MLRSIADKPNIVGSRRVVQMSLRVSGALSHPDDHRHAADSIRADPTFASDWRCTLGGYVCELDTQYGAADTYPRAESRHWPAPDQPAAISSNQENTLS
jgi:hypothetical protein